jgi:TetR/AcrR family transcriptional repressor of nem operon
MVRGENRERLLTEGIRLLREGGFQATGVQEITAACGVPKGSFYNYFDSKTAFGVEVLRTYAEEADRQLQRALADDGGAALGRLRRLYEGWIEGMAECGFKGGCLVGNLTQEMADQDEAFRDALESIHRSTQVRLAEVLRAARERREIGADHDPDHLAEFLMNAWHGALLRMKSAGCDRPLREFVRQVFDRWLAPVTA